MLSEADMSEFQGYTGDCMWLAALGALHALDAAHYNMTATNLNEIVRVAQARREAGAEGQASISDVVDVMRNYYGVSLITYGYGEPFHVDWRALLEEHAGTHPVLLEVAHGGNLPGDERGVNYHGVCQLNRGDYVDGDSAASRGGAMCHYSDDEIAAADPCGAIVFVRTHYQGQPVTEAHYTVRAGDTLSSIAARLHLANWYHELYQPNMAVIEAAARAHGQPDSNGGALIFAGTVLSYRP